MRRSARRSRSIPTERRVLVTSHDAFGYFGRAYGFEVIGLQGVSTASELGTPQRDKLATLIGERRIPAVFTETSVPSVGLKGVLDDVYAKKKYEVESHRRRQSPLLGRPRSRRLTRGNLSRHDPPQREGHRRGALPVTATAAAAIEVHDLTVAYRDNPVLWDVDLTVPPGVLMAVVGPQRRGQDHAHQVDPRPHHASLRTGPRQRTARTPRRPARWRTFRSAAPWTGTSRPRCWTWSRWAPTASSGGSAGRA